VKAGAGGYPVVPPTHWARTARCPPLLPECPQHCLGVARVGAGVCGRAHAGACAFGAGECRAHVRARAYVGERGRVGGLQTQE